jgi:hypothetical protein
MNNNNNKKNFPQTSNKQKASRQTHTQGNKKNNEGKQSKRTKHKWKRAECDHVKKKATKQNPSGI